ncbi:hypothetical protein FACS1894188_05860 [Clostridia bacterium]|nr:hypothetical protein FACS1894188_05860 [Clostridia bacterium]
MPRKKQTFEDALSGLEEITRRMEQPDLPLDALVAHYKDAIDLSQFLNKNLNEYDGIISELTKTARGFEEKVIESEY